MKIQLKILNKEFYPQTPRGKANNYQSDLPSYATDGSAAMDLVCTEDITLCPGERKMIPTGLAVWIGGSGHFLSLDNRDYYGPCNEERLGVAGMILPRSGLGTKGLVLANTVGLIDQDYQGELMVSAWNNNSLYNLISDYGDRPLYETNKPLDIKVGDRFAQLLFIPVIKTHFEIVGEFSNTTGRGDGGFNSTGV